MNRKKYIPTGNEIVSLPMIDEENGFIENINFLHMGYRGLVEFHGCESPALPFLQPYLLLDGEEISHTPEQLQWQRMNYWVPQFQFKVQEIQFTGTYLTPILERGFAIHVQAENTSSIPHSLFLGLRGTWQNCYHTINESRRMNIRRSVYPAKWGGGMMLEMSRETSIACLGLHTSELLDVASWKINNYPGLVTGTQSRPKIVLDENELAPIFWTLGKEYTLAPLEKAELVFYFGLGLDEVGAATAALEMKRQGYSQLYRKTEKWLQDHKLRILKSLNPETEEEEVKTLEWVMNINSFFNYFYSMGNCLDTEELALVTSRSPRYYVSAAYWDRDILYWSLPGILKLDKKKAKEILEQVFHRHNRNVGIHSHYIDGVILEPGFELDELCAPVIALHNYIEVTDDASLLKDPVVIKGLENISAILATKKHPTIALYETFLLPSDDPATYPYVTFDNVLVWRMLNNLADIYALLKEPDKVIDLRDMAKSVRKAIWDNCSFNSDHGWILSWATDLKGNYQIYDDPPGSLQLLPYYGFCDIDESMYLNTMNYFHSEQYKYSFSNTNFPTLGCDHFPHPGVFSIVNDMLSYRVFEGRQLILKAKMDNGIACESIDESTGECATGAAFATLAGFLAYAIHTTQRI